MRNRNIEIKLNRRDKVLLVVFFILFILVGIVMYKTIILSVLIGKENNYETYENAYQEIVINGDGQTEIYKIYKKDNVVKVVTISNNRKITQYNSQNQVRTYTDTGKDKTLNTYVGEGINNNITVNYIGSDTIWEIINDALVSTIKTVELDGVDCYVISGVIESSSAEEKAKSVNLYVEKETGLPVQKIEERQDGTIITTSYAYQFDSVSNKDLIEPSAAEYRSK